MIKIPSKDEKSNWVSCLFLDNGMKKLIECLVFVTIIRSKEYKQHPAEFSWQKEGSAHDGLENQR